MEKNNLFAVLESEEPAVSLGELENYTRRKVRERKIQSRIAVAIMLIAVALTPLMLKQSRIEAPATVASTLPQPPSEVHTEPQVVQRSQPNSVAAIPQRIVRTSARERSHESADGFF